MLIYWEQLYHANQDLALAVLAGILAISLVMASYCVSALSRRVWEIREMRRRGKLKKEILELLEENFVDFFSDMLEKNKITIEDARREYAKLANLGYWGLHPRKFTPKVSATALEDLKERLKAKHAQRDKHDEAMDIFITGLVAERN